MSSILAALIGAILSIFGIHYATPPSATSLSDAFNSQREQTATTSTQEISKGPTAAPMIPEGWSRFDAKFWSFAYPLTWKFHSIGGASPFITLHDASGAIIAIDAASEPLKTRPEATLITAFLSTHPQATLLDARLAVMTKFLAESGETILESTEMNVGSMQAGRIVYSVKTNGDDHRHVTETFFVGQDSILELSYSLPPNARPDASSLHIYETMVASVNPTVITAPH